LSWETYNLKDASPLPPQLHESPGTLFQFLGASVDPKSGRLLLRASVAENSEQQGLRTTISLPDPVIAPWVERVIAQFREAIGADVQEGESPVDALNRQVNTQFVAPVKPRKIYTDADGNERGKDETEINIYRFRAAA
jgi:hypothetical protein